MFDLWNEKGKISWGGNAKGSRTVALTLQNLVKCTARLLGSLYILSQSLLLCVVHSLKQNLTKEKRMSSKMRKRKKKVEQQLQKNVLFFLICDQTSIFFSVVTSSGTLRLADSEWSRPWGTMMLAERVAGWSDSAADLWGLPHALKSFAWGGRVFVRTYLSSIYHITTPPPTIFHVLTCELESKHGSDVTDTIGVDFKSRNVGMDTQLLVLFNPWWLKSDQSESN